MEYILEATELTKKFGNKKAIDNASFRMTKGKIVGLMGPNGSGKTTMMKIMTGLLHQDTGLLTIMGNSPGLETKKSVSFMPDCNILYKWMKVKDAIEFYADMFPDFDRAKSDELIEFMKIDKSNSIKSLSKGMLERLLLVLTLSRKAELYVLDEPLGGVDPVAKAKIIDAILEYYNATQCSILISTHLIKDVERLFDDILFMRKGQIVLEGVCDDLRASHNKSIEDIYLGVFDND